MGHHIIDSAAQQRQMGEMGDYHRRKPRPDMCPHCYSTDTEEVRVPLHDADGNPIRDDRGMLVLWKWRCRTCAKEYTP